MHDSINNIQLLCLKIISKFFAFVTNAKAVLALMHQNN